MVTVEGAKQSDDFLSGSAGACWNRVVWGEALSVWLWDTGRIVGGLVLLCGLVLLTSCRDVPTMDPGSAVIDTWTQVLGRNDSSSAGSMVTQFEPRAFFGAVAMNDKLWVVGGQHSPIHNDVWYSENGSKWEKILESKEPPAMGQFSRRERFGLAVLEGQDAGKPDVMFLVGGLEPRKTAGGSETLKQDIWRSTDGMTWSEVSTSGGVFSPRQDFGFAVDSDGYLWVIGGQDSAGQPMNDVWVSKDEGKTWDEVLDNAGTPTGSRFEQRKSFGLVSMGRGMDKSMYIIGGEGRPGTVYDDVWVSKDEGQTWDKVYGASSAGATGSPSADAGTGFSPGHSFATAVLNDTLYVLGGNSDSGTYSNEVWSSANGARWTRVEPSGGRVFEAREGHQAVAFRDRIWVIGGNILLPSGLADTTNDVWASPEYGKLP